MIFNTIINISGGGPAGPFYYVWQDDDGFVRISGTMPAAAVSGEVLKLPGNLLKLALAEQMVQTDGETMAVSTQIITRGDS